MRQEEQIPRNALVWMIISIFTLVAPHVTRIPVWILAVYVFTALWRTMVYRGRWSFPGRWVKLLLTVASFGGIFASYDSFVGLEPTVALLLTAFALKLIEVAQRKDAYVLLFLGYFICITEFLFSQDILIVVYSLFNVTVVTTALVALHQPGEHQFNRKSMRLAAVMLLQAMPLMIVLFFLFPRIGPLWTIPIKSHSAKTGISDFMKPGDISRLSQSPGLAFRVQFDGEIPASSQLYWRGLVLSRLQEGAWTSLGYYDVPPAERRPEPVVTKGDPLSYRIVMEPTMQNWLYSLRYARSTKTGVMAAPDFRLFSPVVVEDQFLYEVRSWPAAELETGLSEWRRQVELRLPGQRNPLTRQLAQALRAEANSDDEFIDSVLSRFREQPFVYTLQPGALVGEDTMDQFMFQTRRGFCEHYAYAFVLMMRAAGVPARVVAGYQGGEINPVNRTVIVHQFDAHAWTEVWLPDRGWVRVDPTAAVSPDRIELGLEQAMQGEGSFLAGSPLSPLRYRKIAWLNLMRLRYDALTYRWQTWVAAFDNEQQFELLQNLFGEITARKFATLLIGAWALALIPVAISLFRRRDTHQVSKLDRYYLVFCERLANVGVRREAGETALDFCSRAGLALPAYATRIEQITSLYQQQAYAGDSGQTEREREFTRTVRAFRPRRSRGNS